MLKVILLFLFFSPKHELIGAQLAEGAAVSVAACQAHAAQVIEENKANIPKDTQVYPLCIDTGLLPGGDENKKVDAVKL